MAPALAHATPAPVSRRQLLKTIAAAKRGEMDEKGIVNLGAALAIVGVFIAFIVVVLLAAKFIPTIFSSTAEVNTALNDPNVTTGDETADSIKPVFAVVIGLAVTVGLVTLILGAIKFGKGRGS